MSFIKLCGKDGFKKPEDIGIETEVICHKEDTPVLRCVDNIRFEQVSKLYRIQFNNKRWDVLYARPDEKFLTYDIKAKQRRIKYRKIKDVTKKMRFIIPYIEYYDNYQDRFFENFNNLEAEYIFPIVKRVTEIDFDKPNEFRRTVVKMNKRKHQEVDKIIANIDEYPKIKNKINSIINFKNNYPFIMTEDELPVVTSVGTMETEEKEDKEDEINETS